MAAFEMFELGDTQRPLPPVPPIKNESNQNTGPIMPIPPEIKPTLVKYRCWTRQIITKSFSLVLIIIIY